MEPKNSWPGSMNLAFVDAMYAEYLRDRSSVPSDWRKLFEETDETEVPVANRRLGPSFRPAGLFNPPVPKSPRGHIDGGPADAVVLQDRVDQLIRAYRVRGHLAARLDPLGFVRPEPQELDPSFHRLTSADLDKTFSTTSIKNDRALTLRQLLGKLKNTYCRTIGVQFMHIDNVDVKNWLQHRMEACENHISLTKSQQMAILTRLTDAVVFEEFVQKKFVGAKSFSLEGAETLIPLLHLAIEKAGDDGVAEIVFGMAHRGRLNVLANIMGKSPKAIFAEFADTNPEAYRGRGDVKYHLGHNGEWFTEGKKKVHLSLCFNPSHLEFVNPVALGRMRAKQDRYGDTAREKGLVILIHGDAAFAGEGIVQETLNLSELEGYSTGGTIHVVLNNQIGFTTSPEDARSCPYATDVARMLQIPIFHVNGEDPEAVAQVITMALDFRKTFRRDVVVDMYGYRRRGHNEGDEPGFTQPVLYRAIEKRKTVRQGYLEYLMQLGGITQKEADELVVRRRAVLDEDLAAIQNGFQSSPTPQGHYWNGYFGGPESAVPDVETGVSREKLAVLGQGITTLPPDFKPHPKIERLLKTRLEMARGEKPLDWATAEALAFASIVVEGRRIRMTGQDIGRGTFSQRHAVLCDFDSGRPYIPLQHLSKTQGPFEIENSPLSETAVLGFEYGYSLDFPEALVLWEAQFGDFVNVAQPIIDQFIASAEDKWHRLSGVCLLLPHGFEGMGPEHSSARLERFLMMAADDNIQVLYPSTPANWFHALRRQVLKKWKKPMVVMTPKSLLRHPDATSPIDDLTHGTFRRVLVGSAPAEGAPCSRIILCTGKIAYELEAKRRELGKSDVAIVRLEQLHPFPAKEIEATLAKFGKTTPVYFVQEEPENMGTWRYLYCRSGPMLFGTHPLHRVSRPAAASPATGSSAAHKIEQEEILAEAFGEKK